MNSTATVDRRQPVPVATVNPNTTIVYFTHLLRTHTRTMLFWGLGIAAYTMLLIASFPAFEGTSTLDVSQYPEGMREAFNLTSLDAIEPYLSAQVFAILPLVLAFLPITIFAGAIVGAEARGSLDMLFGTPLPRRSFIIATWLAVSVLMAIMLAAVGLLSYGTAVSMDIDLSLADALLATINLLPISMFFGSLALVLSAFVRQRGIAIGIPVGIMFLMYLVDILGKIADRFAPLRNVSAFKAYGDPLQDGMSWEGFALLLALAIAFACAAIPMFKRRDIFT